MQCPQSGCTTSLQLSRMEGTAPTACLETRDNPTRAGHPAHQSPSPARARAVQRKSRSSRHTPVWAQHDALWHRKSKIRILSQYFVSAPILPPALACPTRSMNGLHLWGWAKRKERQRERNWSETVREEIIGKANTKQDLPSFSLPFSFSLVLPCEYGDGALENQPRHFGPYYWILLTVIQNINRAIAAKHKVLKLL